MTEAKFEEIWDKIIKPFIDKILSKNGAFYVADSTQNNSLSRRDIESWYESIKATIKTDFMKNSQKNLDRHKVSASFYIAIAEAAPIKVLKGSLDKMRYLNAYLAFYVSSSVLLSFMFNGSNDPNYSRFLKNNGLQYPKCKNSDSNESYVLQTIKGLCHAQKRRDLNALTIANVFCLLEYRTDLAYSFSVRCLQD